MPALLEFSPSELREVFRHADAAEANAEKLLCAYYAAGGDLELDTPRLSLGKTILNQFGDGSLSLFLSRVADRRVANDGTVKLLLAYHDGQESVLPLPLTGERAGVRGTQRDSPTDVLAINVPRPSPQPSPPLGGAGVRVQSGPPFQKSNSAEAVLMPTPRSARAAGCVSSQIGCAMGCTFCASTQGGLERNLTASEIVDQYVRLVGEARRQNKRLASLVFMGMGEPLHNLPNVLEAIAKITHPRLGKLGRDHVQVSTVGLVPQIDELTELNLGVVLALSLHAPDDDTRSRIVPLNKRWPVAEILAAAERYAARTKTIINVEYCLLAGVNDSDAHAAALIERLRGKRMHINLIPHNSIGSQFSPPPPERVARFLELLRDANLKSNIRVTRGDDVSAACGQLRRRSLAIVG